MYMRHFEVIRGVLVVPGSIYLLGIVDKNSNFLSLAPINLGSHLLVVASVHSVFVSGKNKPRNL